MFRNELHGEAAKSSLIRLINEQLEKDNPDVILSLPLITPSSSSASYNVHSAPLAPESFKQKMKRMRLEKDEQV